MTKLLTYAVAGLLLALYITVSLYIERGREIAALQGEKSALYSTNLSPYCEPSRLLFL